MVITVSANSCTLEGLSGYQRQLYYRGRKCVLKSRSSNPGVTLDISYTCRERKLCGTMKGPKIGGLPSKRELDPSQHRLRMSIVLFLFVILIPRSSISVPLEDQILSKEYSQDIDESQENEDVPVFEQTATNVTAFVGQTIYLPCRVKNLGDKVPLGAIGNHSSLQP
ncbi:hypothetical protein PV327_006038 [Microctonus hyperodae]|uniref:Uncharacterized protein n=1 Tax=Microctonus hyperodae TaxID=165561 RepID=A0AA39G443_MICHY|nr:hypothetical protein PV327_006038 [Microctonus hyperodae]